MSNSLRRRIGVAVLGATVAGSVLAVGAPAQAAVNGGADYTCATPLGNVAFPVAVSSEQIPSTVPAGFDVPSGLIPVNVNVTVPAEFGDTLRSFGVTAVGGSSSTFDMALGASKLPLTGVSIDPVTIVSGQPTVLPASAATGKFTTPDAGQRSVDLPRSFTFAATKQDGSGLASFTCALGTGTSPSIGSVNVVKQTSTTTAKAAKAKVKKGTKAKITVAVAPQVGGTATGTVVAKIGTKKVGQATLKNGKATLTLAKAKKPGKVTVKVTYLGSGATAASAGSTSYKIVK